MMILTIIYMGLKPADLNESNNCSLYLEYLG